MHCKIFLRMMLLNGGTFSSNFRERVNSSTTTIWLSDESHKGTQFITHPPLSLSSSPRCTLDLLRLWDKGRKVNPGVTSLGVGAVCRIPARPKTIRQKIKGREKNLIPSSQQRWRLQCHGGLKARPGLTLKMKLWLKFHNFTP